MAELLLVGGGGFFGSVILYFDFPQFGLGINWLGFLLREYS